MEKHHKIVIGSAGLFVFIFMVITSIFVHAIYIKQNSNYIELNEMVIEIQKELNNTLNNLGYLNNNLNSMDTQLTDLKSDSDFSEIIQNSMKSVVTVKTGISQGSGFFIVEGGYLITNNHVISGADTMSIRIETYDGKIYSFSDNTLSKVGSDGPMDIILFKIENNSYPSLPFGDSDKIKIGQKVIAIGNPLGLEFSVTQGIVSATDKQIYSRGEYLQTDTPLNPGNSGGPLINQNGEVIGINNYKIFLTEGLGFALESNQIKEIVNKIFLEKNGYELLI